MSTMQKFHELLCTSSKSEDRYLEMLRTIANLNLSQLTVVTSDLGWQPW